MDTKERYITTLWSLLEAKLGYYHPEVIHESWKKEVMISDATYDKLEQSAKDMAAELGETFIPVVGFPDTASAKIVRSKLSHKKRASDASCISKVV